MCSSGDGRCPGRGACSNQQAFHRCICSLAFSLCQVGHAAIAATAFPLPTVPAMLHVNWMGSEGRSLTFFPPKRPPSTNIVCLNYNGQYKDGNTKDLLHGGRV